MPSDEGQFVMKSTCEMENCDRSVMNYSECQEDNYYISVKAAQLVADYLLVDLP